MLIDIITASRRVGDVIMCNKVDLKIKNKSIFYLECADLLLLWKDGKFRLNTSTQGCEREQQGTFLCYNTTQSSPKFSVAIACEL